MKANELRIGNVLQTIKYKSPVKINLFYGEFDCQTDSPFTDYPTDYECDRSLSELEPIPLTEEWLVRAGFSLTVSATYSTGGKVDFNVYFKDGFTYNSIQNCWWFNGVLPNQPKYLHQLQNLYFALTGEELEFAQ